jgi:N-acetylglutamate synthase-like GNAT family acetyltransferase
MTEELIIRQATVEDVPSILEIWKELMDFHKELDPLYSRSATGHEKFAEHLVKYIQGDESCVFAAIDGEDLVGYCMATISMYPPVLEKQEYGEIDNIVVTERYRRSRIGESLLGEVRKWYREKGIDRMEAKVSKFNRVSTSFWAKMGFKPYMETVFLEI